jgi:hypothetical protein
LHQIIHAYLDKQVHIGGFEANASTGIDNLCQSAGEGG